MKFSQNKKIIFISFLIIAILFVGELKFVHAWSLFGIADITSGVISSIAQVVGYILGFIGGVFLAIAGYLIQLALNINFELLKSPVVQTGWKIVLNFANLGFVLAIIIIAFATIFRSESYAMKQTLWKLIVAALLVNFSLVIAGAFINVSDIFSEFFLQQGGIRNPVEWSRAFAGMFRAQALLKVSETLTAKGGLDVATAAVNTITGDVLMTIASVFFIPLFTVLAAITLLAVAIMLLIRYVFLGILLLLSPIVWLLWIFPSTQDLWKKWWSQFLRWTFFAPIMLFFIYLAMVAMKYQPEAVRQFTQNPAATANVKLTFGVEIIGEMAIVIGLVMGGLIAANSLGITFAGTAYGWAQSVGKSFGGWVGRKGIQAGTALPRSKWGTKAIEAIEKFGATGKKGLGWRALQTITQPIRAQVGERLSSLAAIGGEKAVAEAKERFKDWDDKRLARTIYSMDAPERVAALQRLRQNKTLDLLPDASAFINQKTFDLFLKYGQPKPDFENVGRATGVDPDSLRALREGKFDKEVINEETGKKETIEVTFESARRAFWKNFRPEHATKMQIDDYFRQRPEFGLSADEKARFHKEDVKDILETNPDILANIYRGIKGQNLDHFNDDLLFKFIDGEVKKSGMESRREWLESVKDPATGRKKYERLLTWMDSSAARSLGAGLGSEDEKKRRQSAGPTMPGYESGKYD